MKQKIASLIIIAYFFIATAEVAAEATSNSFLIIIFKPLLPATLILLYLHMSSIRNWVFVVVMMLSILANVFFIPNNEQMLLYGIITILIHRMMVIYLLIQLLKINDFIPVVIGTIPFLLVFFYLFMISDDIPEHSYFILIVQNMLISLVGGIAISSFIMKDSKRNSWLLLCGLLFVMLHLIIFIEKYYLSQLSPAVLRPIAMSVNVLAFYTFYEFVIAAERSDDNGAAVGGDAVAG